MKIGDYVKVSRMVHDERMPESRSGLIVSLGSDNHTGWRKDVAMIMFENGVFLKFHVSQLEVVVTEE